LETTYNTSLAWRLAFSQSSVCSRSHSCCVSVQGRRRISWGLQCRKMAGGGGVASWCLSARLLDARGVNAGKVTSRNTLPFDRHVRPLLARVEGVVREDALGLWQIELRGKKKTSVAKRKLWKVARANEVEGERYGTARSASSLGIDELFDRLGIYPDLVLHCKHF